MTSLLILFAVGQGDYRLPTEVTKSIQLKPGMYSQTNPIRVTGSNLVLDGAGCTLTGNGTGSGILIGKSQNVTIKNIHLRGFQWGLQADQAAGLKLISVDSSGNQDHPEAMAGTVVADSSGSKEPDYGGGILLRGVTGGLLQSVHAHGQWNGVTLSGCSKTVVEKSDFSKNDATGIHFWNSSDNEVRDCRISQIGVGIVKANTFLHKGGDQAAVLVEHDSNRNKILRNTLVRTGMNGVFIRANETAVMPAAEAATAKIQTVGVNPVSVATHPSNDNLFDGNDGSFAEEGCAFECDFSSGNRFTNNIAAFSSYGFWLGFSRNSTVSSNLIVGNRVAGVQGNNSWASAIESNTFLKDIGANQAMIFSDEEANAAHPRQGAQNPSGDIRVVKNEFFGYGRPFHFIHSTPSVIQTNTFYGLSELDPNLLIEADGPKPLFLANKTDRHTQADGFISKTNMEAMASAMDTLGGVTVIRLVDKATEAIVEGSLTGKFQGEEYEIARDTGPAPITMTFPERIAPFVRIKGGEPVTGCFLARLGDTSLGKFRSTDSSSGGNSSSKAVDSDWISPDSFWTPTNVESGQWWQVDIGHRSTIRSIAIAPGLENPNAFFARFHVLVSDTGAFAGEEQEVVREGNWFNRPGPVRRYKVGGVRGRYVRVVGEVAQKEVQLEEFGIYGSISD